MRERHVTSAQESLIDLINPEYRSEGFARDLADWYRQVPAEPMHLRDFLKQDFAERMDAMMRDLPIWTTYATAATGPHTMEDVDPSEWDAHPRAFARHLVATPLEDALVPGRMSDLAADTLKTFLAFAVVGDAFRGWLSGGIARPLSQILSLELAAYRAGDLISIHQDLLPGRIMAVNFYLDRSYVPGTGGRLGYRNEIDREFMTEPLFNSLSMIPIREECWHWVERFTGEGVGRFTVSMGQQDPATTPAAGAKSD